MIAGSNLIANDVKFVISDILLGEAQRLENFEIISEDKMN